MIGHLANAARNGAAKPLDLREHVVNNEEWRMPGLFEMRLVT